MPEYVYALHDFQPENEDEVSFRAGEKIEVVERDDLYGDGWWQGRNLAGNVGLFPQSYTAPTPPSAEALANASAGSSSSTTTTATTNAVVGDNTPSSSSLQPLHEESEPESTHPPSLLPAILLNGEQTAPLPQQQAKPEPEPDQPNGEVMKATMTDVQQAIEQLGRTRSPNNTELDTDDGGRSMDFSFASSKDDDEADSRGGETETETGTETDTDGFDTSDADGEDWHKGARRKLAEKARRAVAEAEKMEDIMRGPGPMVASLSSSSSSRVVAPPIEVEVSDESDEDDDERDPRIFGRSHSNISERDEEEDEQEGSTSKDADTTVNGSIAASEDTNHVVVPPRDDTDAPTATAPRFPSPSPVEKPQSDPSVEPEITIPPTPTSPGEPPDASEKPPSTPTLAPLDSKHSSLAASSSTKAGPLSPLSQSHNTLSHSVSVSSGDEKKHPTEWSEEEVVEWLKGRGFDQDVCDKFAEQEITGDVLLELDVNLLKTEIGILPFGKRMRIANAITDLRRPPSIVYSDIAHTHTPHHHQQQPQHLYHNQFNNTNNNQQQNIPPTPTYTSHTHSRNQSFGGSLQGSMYANNSMVVVPAGLMSPESAPNTGDLREVGVMQEVASDGRGGGSPSSLGHGHGVGVGLGLGMGVGMAFVGEGGGGGSVVDGRGIKPRPTQLNLSPSDGALNATAAKAVSAADIPEEVEEERGAVSENEAAAPSNTVRRRLFGRSHDSSSKGSKRASTASGGSIPKEGTSPMSLTASPMKVEKEKDAVSVAGSSSHHRPKKSVDVGSGGVTTKSSERMSLFGGFGSTIGKGRKPVPRYSAINEDGTTEKAAHGSGLSLTRLYGSKKASQHIRPSTSDGISSKQDGDTPNAKDAKRSALSPKSGKRKASTVITTTPPTTVHAEEPAPTSPRSHKDKEPKESKDATVLRKRTSSTPNAHAANTANTSSPSKNGKSGALGNLKAGQSIMEQIGEPDHNGWMRKRSDRYNGSWKLRYFVLKGVHLYWLKTENPTETRIKGYINIIGYKVVVDENVDPGRYGFKIVHDNDKPHYFSSEEKTIVRDWMKAIMKATIGRDYTKPVVSSCNIPTIPLMVAQAMNPAPRPPSPTARDATQKLLRREHPDQLSSRDARVLMGLPSSTGENTDAAERGKLDTVFTPGSEDDALPSSSSPKTRPAAPPPRPSREGRRTSIAASTSTAMYSPIDDALLEWANAHLPSNLRLTDSLSPPYSGLALLRLAESIKGRPTSPPILDSAFPSGPNDDKLDGLFRLFDFLLDNDVKMGSVSINDVRQGKTEKIVQLLRALKAWEDKRRTIAQSIGKGGVQAGYVEPKVKPFVYPLTFA